jgi:hypothetical protein
MDNNNGWGEYRRLVVEWHEQDVAERKEIKESLVEQQQQTTAQLKVILDTLNTIQTERKIAKYFGGIVLPIGVTVGVNWVARKLGF